MSEAAASEPAPLASPAQTAGGLLREARQAKGLHIAALATAIKVAPRKLELLEADRFDELPGATFTRALAQTVCRSLKIDSAPVLALLPQANERSLESMSLGLNAPFRDRPDRRVPSDLQFLKSPIVLGALLLVLAAAAIYLLPAGWINDKLPQAVTGAASDIAASTSTVSVMPPANADPASAAVISAPLMPASEPSPTPLAVAEPKPVLASAPVEAPAASQAASAATARSATTGALLLRASAESWVEVVDGRGQSLLSRSLQAGETVGLDGASPLQVRIGNASATTVSFKGRPVELTPSRDNVAKLVLK